MRKKLRFIAANPVRNSGGIKRLLVLRSPRQLPVPHERILPNVAPHFSPTFGEVAPLAGRASLRQRSFAHEGCRPPTELARSLAGVLRRPLVMVASPRQALTPVIAVDVSRAAWVRSLWTTRRESESCARFQMRHRDAAVCDARVTQLHKIAGER